MISAVIVASGKGKRMNGAVRKQYLDLAGRPILAHTLMAFNACDLIDNIFLVVSKKDFDYCQKHVLSCIELHKKVLLVPGGARRQDSVYNGLQALHKETDTVVIHDGVRPFVNTEQLVACIMGAKSDSACILGIPASDTLKLVNPSGHVDQTLDRDAVWMAQTPQAFRYDLILKAHDRARKHGDVGTDDALLVERLGILVKIIRGSRHNIKITIREDLDLARAILKMKNEPP
jgi:2-C-methyl-D-erythritol 4-phosphate cytidylyltransferase